MTIDVEYDAYVGDKGIEIIIDVGTDISGATVRKIKYKKPVDGKTGYWTAAEKTTTSIAYVTQATDLNEAGTWELQAYVEKSTWKLHGEKKQFKVGGSIA